jgi:hypothetical protein
LKARDLSDRESRIKTGGNLACHRMGAHPLRVWYGRSDDGVAVAISSDGRGVAVGSVKPLSAAAFLADEIEIVTSDRCCSSSPPAGSEFFDQTKRMASNV